MPALVFKTSGGREQRPRSVRFRSTPAKTCSPRNRKTDPRRRESVMLGRWMVANGMTCAVACASIGLPCSAPRSLSVAWDCFSPRSPILRYPVLSCSSCGLFDAVRPSSTSSCVFARDAGNCSSGGIHSSDRLFFACFGKSARTAGHKSTRLIPPPRDPFPTCTRWRIGHAGAMDLEKHARKIEAIHLAFVVFGWTAQVALFGYAINLASIAAEGEDVRMWSLYALVFPLCLFGAIARWVRRKHAAQHGILTSQAQ